MKMMKLAVGFAAGYVLGTRAGREKFEQIAATARKVGSHPKVVQAQEKATALINTGVEKTNAKLASIAPESSSTTPAPSHVTPSPSLVTAGATSVTPTPSPVTPTPSTTTPVVTPAQAKPRTSSATTRGTNNSDLLN
ncbi:hypothetical protein [Actinoplanes awajinensis]|uniref:Protoporphyrinogen oxidase n=1 Tax=Actinoplanes awajinensis subsp. mycoplanecinus TaxID=135947 RepID=A0A101J8Z5_9ACTN|nr:hypothetical protein [Actinoplanes awajinensis]KUL22397.1 hypothetical protein ADL15_48565 [Actinoplanes awajinensis subsp. mycoplanecinus]